MTDQTIDDAQDYLTLVSENRVKKIMDVKSLMQWHPSEAVISVLRNLAKQKEQMLMELIETDKTSSIINETVATMFRLHMAITTIQNSNTEQEVKAV